MLEFFPYPFLGALSLLAVWLILTRRKPGRLRAGLLGLYLLVLVGLTLFPVPPVNQRSSAAELLARINWRPFYYLQFLQDYTAPIIAREMILNVAATVPFGFFIRARGWRLPLAAVAPGLAIETGQLLASLAVGAAYRTVDISDVLLNSAGVLLGMGLAWLFTAVRRTRLTGHCPRTV